MLRERILNPSKRNNVHGTVFSLVFLGTDVVMFDSNWDEPVFYAPKGTAHLDFVNPKLFPSLKNQDDPKKATYANQILTIFVYKKQASGEIRRQGAPLTGTIKEIKFPNY